MTVKEIIKKLNADGWFEVDQVGSHKQFKHKMKKGKVTVPVHKGDVNIKTAKSIFKQAGLLR